VRQSAALVTYPLPKRPAGNPVRPLMSCMKKMRMDVPATAAAKTAVVVSNDAVMPRGTAASKSENAVSLLNQYRQGLNFQIVNQVGPAHAPIFTAHVEIDGKVCILTCC
jgi:Double-stranded RNA binding motif